jgi:hypothetical protein
MKDYEKSKKELINYISNLNEDVSYQKDINNVEKFEDILKIIYNFVIENKVILYGGMAMNLYLPINKRFYGPLELPDYDGFSTNPDVLSKKLVVFLKKNNYNYLMVKNAIHEGTFKVSWEFNDVLDLTKISKSFYNEILSKSTKINNLFICPLELLKCMTYFELCIPISSLFRWEKIYPRISLLEEHHPNKIKSSISLCNIFSKTRLPDYIHNIVDIVYTYVIKNELPLIGNIAIKRILGFHSENFQSIDKRFRYIQVLSYNVDDTIQEIIQLLKKFKDIRIKNTIRHKNQIVPIKYSIDIIYKDKTYKIVSIHDCSKHCYNFITDNGIKYCTSFYVVYILYFYLFKNLNIKNNILNEKIKLIINAVLTKINKEDFSVDCLGFEKTLSAIKLSRAKNNKPAIYYKASITK